MKKTIKLFLLILSINLLLLNFLPIYAQNSEPSAEEGPVIYTEQDSSYIDFYIYNKELYDITITITFPVLENMASTKDLPYSLTVYGGDTVQAFSLYFVNPNLDWNYNYEYHWTIGSMEAEHDDSYIYSLPYESGYSYSIVQGFNSSFSHFGDDSYAIDWDMPEGTPVLAAREGVVVDIKDIYSEGKADPSYKNYGNYVMIRHYDGTIGRYYHFMQYGIEVSEGQEVEAGDYLGLSGNTGYTTGPHLHFDVFKALDGYRRETLPIMFETMEYPDGQVLEESEIYMAP